MVENMLPSVILQLLEAAEEDELAAVEVIDKLADV